MQISPWLEVFPSGLLSGTPGSILSGIPGDAEDAEHATRATVNILAVFSSAAVGAAVGLIVGLVSSALVRIAGKRHRLLAFASKRGQISWIVTLMLIGAALAFSYVSHQLDTERARWVTGTAHGLLILCILSATWWIASLVNVIEDITHARYGKGGTLRSRRLTTQAQVIRRVAQAVIVVVGISAAVLTFPQARAAMGSILASAGLVSLIAGLAAQSTLANMFAGLQIAFSDAIRVDDVVVVNGTQGTIEELTLTYVVVRLWDDRRLILPSKHFTSEPFENWTRRASQLLGTVELDVDWSVPVPLLRAEVERLLGDTDLWDGRTFNVQMTEATDGKAKVRVVVSAQNAGDLWDLRCYLREHLVDWMQGEVPYALMRERVEMQEVRRVDQDLDAEEVQERAIELIEMSRPEAMAQVERRLAHDSRRSWRDKATHLGDTPRVPDDSAPLTATRELSVERLYSGSPEAEERAKMMTGPDAAAMAEREAAAAEKRGLTGADAGGGAGEAAEGKTGEAEDEE